MSDMGEVFSIMKERRRLIRHTYGEECVECKRLRPNGNAKVLLPGQTCGYRHKDTRSLITESQYKEIDDLLGIKRIK